jgi:hypothetical protein
VYSLVLAGGINSAPYGLGQVGPTAGISLRRDSRSISLEARLAWAWSRTINSSDFGVATHQFAATLAALHAFDLGPLTLSAGLDGGILVMHQKTTDEQTFNPNTSWPEKSFDEPRQSLSLPGQLSATNTCSPVLAPLVQLDSRLLRKLYARFDAELPLTLMPVKNSHGVTSWSLGRQFRLSAGVGSYF